MSVYLRFEPVPGAERTPFDFVPASIFLAREEEAFVIGFLRKANMKALEMEVDAHDENVNSEESKTSSAASRKPGFSDNPYDDKLTIVPLHSKEAKEMQDPLGGIWLAPGYKVMLLPAEGCRMYYQRAVPDNESWRRIKKGWAFDLAEPLMHALDGAVHIKIDTRIPRRRDVLLNALHDAFHPRSHTTSSSTTTTANSTPGPLSDPLSAPAPSSVSTNISKTKSTVAIPGVNVSVNTNTATNNPNTVTNINTNTNTSVDAHVSTRPASSHGGSARALATRIHTAITGGRVHTASRPAYHVLARVTVDWRPRGWVRPPSVRERTALPLPARLVEPMVATPPEDDGAREGEGNEEEVKEKNEEKEQEKEEDGAMDIDHVLEDAVMHEDKEEGEYERCQYARVASWLTRTDDGGESDTDTDTDPETEAETTSNSTEASDITTESEAEENLNEEAVAATTTEGGEEFEETQLYNHVYLNEDAKEGLRRYAAALAARHARGIWPRVVRKVPVPSVSSEAEAENEENESETEAEIRDGASNTCTNTDEDVTSEERDEFVDAIEAPTEESGREEEESGLQTPKANVTRIVELQMRDVVDPDATPRPRAGTQGRIGYD